MREGFTLNTPYLQRAKENLFTSHYTIPTFLLGVAAGLIVFDECKKLIKVAKNMPPILKEKQKV